MVLCVCDGSQFCLALRVSEGSTIQKTQVDESVALALVGVFAAEPFMALAL